MENYRYNHKVRNLDQDNIFEQASDLLFTIQIYMKGSADEVKTELQQKEDYDIYQKCKGLEKVFRTISDKGYCFNCKSAGNLENSVKECLGYSVPVYEHITECKNCGIKTIKSEVKRRNG